MDEGKKIPSPSAKKTNSLSLVTDRPITEL